MTSEPSTTSLDIAERPETLPVTRGAVGSTQAEDVSFINVREVEDWCDESREYRPPLFSSTTLLSVSLGALVGFVPAFAATDSKVNGGWWGIFLLGSILASVGCVAAIVSMTVPALSRKLGRDERMTPLERLAERMESLWQRAPARSSRRECAKA